MSTESFLRELERVAEVPDAVERFRSSIVELALRGRLTASDPVRLSADPVNLDHILQGMETLVQPRARYRWAKRGLAPSSQFEAPKGWLTTELANTGLYVNGIAFKPSDWRPSGRPIIRIQNLSGLNRDYNYADGDFSEDNLVNAGDLLVSWSATLDTYLWEGPQGVVNQHIFKVIPNQHAVTPQFLYWLLKHEVRQLAMSQHAHGLAMMHINRGPFLEHAVLLPPLAEQHRIVATVEELIALCDQLEAAQNDRESQRSALLSAALHRLTTSENGEGNDSDIGFFLKSSPRLMTRPEHLDGVRQAILDLAVQGRLVRQVPEDAPASDFLQHSQNASGYSDEFSDDKPLPPGWGKATVGQLSSMVTSGSRGWAEFYSETGSAFIRAQNIRFGQLRLDDLAHVTLPERHEGKRTKADRGDILIVITGAGVTNPALLEIDMADAYVSQHVGLVKLRSKEIAPWILLCLMARKGCRDDLVSRAYGAGKPGLNLDNIRTLVAPVPPLAEQRRIIAKVSELMTVCDELETALDSANHERVRILDALLHDVLSERDGPATPVMALAGT